jgi:hypothetical protein
MNKITPLLRCVNHSAQKETKFASSSNHHQEGQTSQMQVAHARNLSYVGGRDQEDHSSKPAPAK